MTDLLTAYFDLLTVIGEDLDRLAYELFGFTRPKGQTDADFRERLVKYALGKPENEYVPELITYHVPKLSDEDKKARRLKATVFISPPSSLDKDKLQ